MYFIPTANIETLSSEFAKLAKRASKLGVQAPTFHIVGTEMRKMPTSKFEYEVSLVEVTQEIVKFNGWQLVAVLDHTPNGNVYKKLPGAYEVNVPESYRNVGSICEHCNKVRDRVNTYIVLHDDGTFKQVGKSCLKDFTGHKAPEQIAQFLEMLDDACTDNEEYNEAAHSEKFQYINGVLFLSHVSAVIRENGWTSGAKAKDLMISSTKDQALNNIYHTTQRSVYAIEVLESDRELAQNAFAWIAQQEASNEYMTNLKIACADNVSKVSLLGFVASLIPAYNKAMGYEIERKLAAATSNFLGEVKGKVKATATLTAKKYIDSYYGTSVLHNFVDTQGNQLVWFSSNDTSIEIGETTNVTGTVKEHKEWLGVKQTVLTRCKLS